MAIYYILHSVNSSTHDKQHILLLLREEDETYVFTWSAQSVNSICALLPLCHRWTPARGRLHHDEASRPWKRFQNGGSLNRKTVFPALTVYLRSFRTSLLVMLWVRLKNEQGPLIRYVSFLLRSVLKQRAFQDVLQRIIQGVSCCHFSWVDLLSVTFFLLGLDKAEKDPYKGWKTNCFQGDSPENEYVSASNRKI